MADLATEPERTAITDPELPLARLCVDLDATPAGLSGDEAARRRAAYGPNELRRHRGVGWPRELVRQLTHPLALLLWLAAALAAVDDTPTLAYAIVAVIALNAALAFAQERQAERAVEALAGYLPAHATVRRDGNRTVIAAADLVPGDVLVLEAGDRVSADAHLIDGTVDVDMSALTGESVPVTRSATDHSSTDPSVTVLHRHDLVFSGTTCVAGEASALVYATGMATQIGRIASLSQRITRTDSPLERQVKRVAWLIAAVAIGAGIAFVPIGTLAARLSLPDAVTFAIGLLVANVPEGLLPTITLALAVGVRSLAAQGALVKRLSAVETLGSTTVICTDKTGTLTENRMVVTSVWTRRDGRIPPEAGAGELAALAEACALCNDAEIDPTGVGTGDPTEIAVLAAAARMGADPAPGRRARLRRHRFAFDPALRLMSTVDTVGGAMSVHVKGAPEDVLARSARIDGPDGERPMSAADRAAVAATVDAYAEHGLRVLALAHRVLPGPAVPESRAEAERDLTFLGLVAMYDPPRPEVAGAVARCRTAGIRMIVVTGDHGRTAAEIARRLGVTGPTPRVVLGGELDAMDDVTLARTLRTEPDLIFARTSPEAKLRIARALQHLGEVVAMTGDGVNDAPALRRADIGVAMGRAGTDVARESATMVLTDDNFASIVTAVQAGRRVYDNVRKFIVYIFAHATPEVVPFLVYALSGGRIPLPLTVLQILAIDLGTETLPALALGREPAEAGIMDRPPRPRGRGVIDRAMLVRAWLVLGGVSAALVLAGYFATLLLGGWSPGVPTGPGTALHHVWQQATTMTFLGIVACQIGTAMASRSLSSRLRRADLFSNRLLWWGFAFEVVFAALVVAVPAAQRVFGTAVPPLALLPFLLLFPLVTWSVDAAIGRRRSARRARARLRAGGA